MTDLQEWILDEVNNNRNDCVAFEAFGTPGAGKSYFCDRLKTQVSKKSNSLRYHFIDDYHQNRFLRILSKMSTILRSCWFRWDLVLLANKFVFRFDGIQLLIRIRLIFNFLLVYSVIKTGSEKGKAILLDQGIFQGLWSCFFAKEKKITSIKLDILKPLIFELIDSLELDLLVIIYVSASKEKVINGLQTRKLKGSSKLNSLQTNEIERGIETTFFVLELIKDIVVSHPKIKLKEIYR